MSNACSPEFATRYPHDVPSTSPPPPPYPRCVSSEPLFGDQQRTESVFDFLDRVSAPALAAPRAILEDWYTHWPAEDRNDIRRRLQAKGREQFFGAFWEMYLHELHRRLGFACERDPKISGSSKHPDFLMSRGGNAFYLEGTIVGHSTEEVSQQQRERLIIDQIGGAYHPDFSVRVRKINAASNHPPKAAVVKAVEDWLATLDRETETERRGEAGRSPQRIEVAGSVLYLLPWPKPADARGNRSVPTVVARSGGGGIIDEPPTILDDLRDKASRYGDMDRPYVVAVLCLRDFATDRDVEQALYGPDRASFSLADDGTLIDGPRIDRDPDGLWQRGDEQRATRVSAVLSSTHLSPWSLTSSTLELWLNPWTARPLTVELPWSVTSADLEANTLIRADASRAPHEVLGLPDDWPASLRVKDT